MDADEHAPPPYDGTMSDPLASPSQSQTLNAARLARLRTAGRRAADAEPAAPAAPPIADVAALDARAEELLRRCDSLLARTQPPAPPEPEPEPEPEAPAAVDPIASDAAAVVDLISEVVIGGFSPRASAYSSPPASPQRLPARSPARTPPASPARLPASPPRSPPRLPTSPPRAPASPPRQLPPRVPPGEVEALRRRAAPHASDSVVKTLLARIAAVESKLGGVDAAAARRPLIEDRFVF
jgi:hypothetical protein